MLMKIPISGVDLKELIPQKDPIVMISSLETYQENALQSSFLVTKECIFIQDVELAETGLIEHMAQSVALHTGYSFYLQNFFIIFGGLLASGIGLGVISGFIAIRRYLKI